MSESIFDWIERYLGSKRYQENPNIESEEGAQRRVDEHRENETHDLPQPTEDHGNESHTEEYVTTDENVENFPTDGDENTVPVSQGDGTVEMVEVQQTVEVPDVPTLYSEYPPEEQSADFEAYIETEDDYVKPMRE